MLTKNQQKYIRSLSLKKNRDADHVFLAEGSKVVGDLLGHYPCKLLAGPDRFIRAYGKKAETTVLATEEEIARASLLKSPREVLALFDQTPLHDVLSEEALLELPTRELVLLLDDVQDPGNLGTIIRLADWFGIHHVVCSLHTADVFSPKVVQATMGSLARVRVHYLDPLEYVSELPTDTPVYGTFLDGKNIYDEQLTDKGLIVMGNEGKGISAALTDYITHRLYIPNYPIGTPTGESLNVAIATAVTCAEFRRQMLAKGK
ncbi:MAG: RNA methyltransferase [Alloprevotella sp.]